MSWHAIDLACSCWIQVGRSWNIHLVKRHRHEQHIAHHVWSDLPHLPREEEWLQAMLSSSAPSDQGSHHRRMSGRLFMLERTGVN
jgi:hypothetical protein